MVASPVPRIKRKVPSKSGPCCRKSVTDAGRMSPCECVLDQTRGKHWELATLAEVVGHTVRQTDVLIIPEVDRLDSLLAEVCAGHAVAHPELLRVYTLFYWLKRDLMNHIMNESDTVFPYIVRMERAIRDGEALPKPFFQSVRQTVKSMMVEHDAIDELMRSLSAATCGFEPPYEACAAFRRLYSGLAMLSANLRELIQLENYVIFPRAVELESRYQSKPRAVQ